VPGRRFAAVGLAAALLAAGTGPVAYALQTAGTVHRGPIPVAGPVGRAGMPGDRWTPPTRRATGATGPGARAGRAPATTPDPALVARLAATSTTWAAAVPGSEHAAALQLAAGRPVMAIGGFSGGDPAPTLNRFTADVASGRIRYFIPSRVSGMLGGEPTVSDAITAWVQAHYRPVTVDGQTVYDLAYTAAGR
jgi:hypothetical protein